MSHPKKVVVVSGASGLLGSVVCAQFAKNGWTVVPLTRADCDFTDPRAIQKTLAAVVSRHQVINAAVHTAWPKFARTALSTLTLDEWELQFSAAKGSMIFFTEIIRPMRAQGYGTLFGITTAALDANEPGVLGAYLPAKAAVRAMLGVLRRESGPVVVHEVAPGFMRGGLNADLPPRLFELLAEKGLVVSPESVANQIVLFAEHPHAV